MKWLIASDIHGSAFYCKLLLERYKEENAERLVLLGDILYHGPRNDLPHGYAPKEVISLLNAMKNDILCVRGNCDSDVDQMVLEFPILADYAIITIGSRILYATHGHIFNENHLPPLRRGDILLNGHTHIPKCIEHSGYIYMNPGSVSIPKENSHHGYILMEDTTFIWKNLEGKVISTYSLLQSS